MRNAGLIPNHTLFYTPQQIGGVWSPFRAMELAGYKEGEAQELVASLSPLAQVEHAEAIALLPEAVQPAVRALLGSAWSLFRAMELAGYTEGAARELVERCRSLGVTSASTRPAQVPKEVWPAVRNLLARFGNKNAAKEAATLLRTRGGPTQLAFFQAVKDGMSMQDLAAKFQVSSKTISRIKDELHLTTPPRQKRKIVDV